ncbi:MAG: L,D-transpeptidase/peptidoglycan binding protein, partial [Chloroflexota bacterium]|nr:L,D-transpeptidase/peptidoglycan binding protein [Chloroflexota bacterium]
PVALVVRETRPAVTEQQLAQVSEAVALAWSKPLNVAFQDRRWALPIERVRALLSLQGGGAQVRPQVDQAALRSWVLEVASGVNRDPRNAQVNVSPGSVKLVAGREGYEVDTPATVARFSSAILAGSGSAVPVVNVMTPDITDQELTQAVANAHQMVSRPLSLELGSKRWSLDPGTLTDMLRWHGAGADTTPYLDPAPLRQWGRSIASDVYTPPTDARIEVTDAGARVIPDRAGVEVGTWKTMKALQAATLNPAGRVTVATRRIPAEVVAADLQKAAEEANRLIGSPIELTLGDQIWTVDKATLREWLRWSGEGAKQAPYLDNDEMAAFISSIESEIYEAPENAYVTIESGVPELVSEQEGVKLDTEAALALLGTLTDSERRSAQLPTVPLLPDVRASDLQAEYELMSSWTSDRLYLKLGELTWWLDREDITEAVWWNGQGGTELNPYLGVDTMEQQIRLFVTEPPDTIIDYRATAEDAVAALEDGNRTVEITSRHLNTPSSPHIGDEARWAGQFPDKWIDLNLTTQSMAAYEGGKQVRVSLITSGRPELATPTGVYSVMDKLSPYTFISPWPKGHKWWYPTADANFALRFRHGGLYIHDAPWRSVYGPGTNGSGRSGAASTGSHGCVNVPYEMMVWLYGWSEVGTTIVIHY